MMNVFRITADILHLFSIFYLLFTLFRRKDCGSVSGKSQLLFAIVYSARYLDLYKLNPYDNLLSTYLFTFKCTYIFAYWIIVLMIFVLFKSSYKKTEDSFLTEGLLVPSFVLALWFNYDSSPFEILWTFSIYLESVAILPQFYMIYKQRSVEKRLMYYLVPLGLYRMFYVFKWIYRFSMEGHTDAIADSAGLVYVGWYVCALVGFFVFNIKLTDDVNHCYKNNIFLISNNTFENPLTGEEKLTNEQLLPEDGLENVQVRNVGQN